MPDALPLVARLSAAHVALTIELDNLAEARLAHRTTTGRTRGQARRGPWLASVAIWDTCLRWLSDGEATVAEVRERARTGTNLDGVRRWGYATIDGRGARDGRRQASRESVLTLTPAGRRAVEVWGGLDDEVEQRWRDRFGGEAIEQLRDALTATIAADETLARLPDTLPILGHGLFSRVDELPPAVPGRALRALLSRVLLGVIVDYERGVKLSLPVLADVLRLLDDTGVRIADLPGRSGVSKEALAMALGLLERVGCIELWSADRSRMVRLTERGDDARRRGLRRVRDRERQWRERVGVLDALSGELRALVGDGTREGSPLYAGLQAPPGCWRASARAPERLPWCSMVWHRGGFPDGA